MNYKSFNLGDWIGHISGVIEDESELDGNEMRDLVEFLSRLPRWIPCSERLPEDLETVNVTWVNHEPEPYYHDIKDKSFVATAIFSKRTGHWYWYSTTCADYLGEYGDNEIDKVDDAIEIIAWMPLPEPYNSENKTKQGLAYADQDTLMSAT